MLSALDKELLHRSNKSIGIFDSGVGGLSVLHHIRKALPHEDLLYFADSGFAPYGNKPDAVILNRAFTICDFLLAHGAKALVVACNTATAVAIQALRERYPEIPLVGVEPGLKPAALLSHTKIVGVLATRSTLTSEKFARLQTQITTQTNTRFLLQACSGLASQIEKGELESAATAQLVRQYVAPLIERGADTLVLGCTHYPFVLPLIRNCLRTLDAHTVQVLDTGAPVSRQLSNLLAETRLQRLPTVTHAGSIQAFTSGTAQALSTAFSTLLELTPRVMAVAENTAKAHSVCQSNAKFV